jgi:hypothetical protein
VDRCFVCGCVRNLERHHIFGGSNRKHSEKYGLVVYLCAVCHRGNDGVHYNRELMNRPHEYGQMKFQEQYPELNFREIFRKNYLEV